MAIQISDNIASASRTANLDAKFGPYTSKQAVIDELVSDGSNILAVNGLTVGVIENNNVVEYVFKNVPANPTAANVTVNNLFLKQVAVQEETDPTVPAWAKQETKPSYTASEVGAIPSSEKGVAGGVATLGSDGKVPQSQLPSYVDDVSEYSNQSSFPSTGESGKIYVALDTNKTYRWSGSAYVEISQSLALGETSSTAFAGDRGKAIEDKIPSNASSSNKMVTASDLNGKVDKVSGATPNNFASFDANGGIKDSDCNEASFATAAQGAKADKAVQSVSVDPNTVTGDAGTNASVTNTGTQTAPVLKFTIPRGADGQDGADAVNPFKGMYITTSDTNIPSSGQAGDYIFIADANPATTIDLYFWNTEKTPSAGWDDTGYDINPGSLAEFAGGTAVSMVHIINDFTTGGSTNVASAETMKELYKNNLIKVDESCGKNILNITDIFPGYLDSEGNVIPSSTYHYTKYIKILPSTHYKCTKSDSDNFGASGRYHVFYDENFTFISSVLSTISGFDTPSNAYYARFSIRDSFLTMQLMVNVGTSRGVFEEYNPIYGYVQGLSGEIEGVKKEYVPIALSKNLLDINNLSVGYLYGDNQENYTNDTYRKSDYIKVTQGDYFLSAISQVVQGSATPVFAFYDDRFGYIGKQQWESTSVSGIKVTVPAGASYVRLTLYKASVNDSLQFEAGTQRTSYEHYSKIYGYTQEILNNLRELTPAKNAVGRDGLSTSIASLSGEALTITGYPQYIKSNGIVSAGGKITQFNQVVVGYGYGAAMGKYAKVDSTNIILCSTSSNGTERTVETVAHGLTISEFIDVVLSIDGYNVKVVVSTLGGYNTLTHTYTDVDSGNGLVESMSGTPSIIADSTTQLTDVTLRVTSNSFRFPVWVIGDSYTSQNTERWPYYARYKFGVRALWIGLSGGQSSQLFPDLEKALSFGCPKFLVWCLGMNDTYSNYQAYFAKVKDICDQNGIEIVAGTIPLVPLSDYANKNEDINDYIKLSGVRYIDFATAVGADTTSTWYEGCLSNDNIHPTAKGAKCLFAGVFKDFPEIINESMA